MTPITADAVTIGDIIWLANDSSKDTTKSIYLAVRCEDSADRARPPNGINLMCLVSSSKDLVYRCRVDTFHWWMRSDLVRLGNIYEPR